MARLWRKRLVGVLPWLALVAVAAPYVWLMGSATTASFWPDSWAYRELAETVFRDFYRISTVRSFDRVSDYGWSFPPLWPVTLAVADRVCGGGAAGGVAVACGIALLSGLPVYWMFRQSLKRRALAVYATAAGWGCLLLCGPYLTEVAAAGSIPLTVLLLLVGGGLWLSVTRRPGAGRAFLLGLVLGAACLARFDATPVALVVVGCFWFRSGLRCGAAAALGLVLALTPWIGYSRAHFGKVWVTDNAVVAVSARNFRSYYWGEPKTVAGDPVGWTKKVAGNGIATGVRMVSGLHEVPVLLALMALAAAMRRKVAGSPLVRWHGFALAGLAGPVLTGYLDLRYFTFAYVTLAMALIGALFRGRRLGLRLICVFQGVFLIAGSTAPMEFVRQHRGKGTGGLAVAEGLDEVRGSTEATVLGGPACFEFGATTKIHTVCLPGNWEQIAAEEQARFFAQYRVTHLLLCLGAACRVEPCSIKECLPNWRLASRGSANGMERFRPGWK